MADLITIGEVFDKTIAHYKKHFTELIGISAWILIAALPAAIAKILDPFTAGTETGPLYWVVFILKNVGGLLFIAVSFWALITVIIAISDEAAGTPKKAAEQGKQARKLFFPYVWVNILLVVVSVVIMLAPIIGFVLVIVDAARNASTILSTIGGVLLLVGGIISSLFLIKFSIQYGFAAYALILDNARGTKALKHSASLVKGRWWATFFRFALPSILYTIILVAANFLILEALTILVLLTIGAGPVAEGIGNSLWFLSTVALGVFLTPLVAVTDYHIYDSLRKSR